VSGEEGLLYAKRERRQNIVAELNRDVSSWVGCELEAATVAERDRCAFVGTDGLSQPRDQVIPRLEVAVVRRSNGFDEQRQRNTAHGNHAIMFFGPFVVHAKPFC
jgi:hypothetical protein